MNRPFFIATLAIGCLLLAACGADAEADGAAVTPSAVIRQVMPERGTFDDVVVAYGQGAAVGGARVLALPLDVTLTEVDVVAGQHVARGQRLAVFAPASTATVARAVAGSSVTLAREQRDRLARLVADRLATHEQLAQADKALHDAEAVLAAQRTPDNVLRAPAEGIVQSIDAQREAIASAGASLMTFAEGRQMGFSGGIEPVDTTRVHPGDKATLTPLSGGATVSAHVVAVASAIDPASRLVDITAAPTSPLLPGAAYRAEIVVGTLEGWRIPTDAVLGDDGDRVVWQVVDGKAHRVPVTVVAQHGDEALVDGPVDTTRPFATVGAAQLEEGVQIRPAGSK
jgi:RND family efflux transporter MFP subunit